MLCAEKEAAGLPVGTRRFSYSSQAAYPRPTAKLGLRPQTVAPSGAASLLVPTENQRVPTGRPAASFSGMDVIVDRTPVFHSQKQEKCTPG